MYDCLVSVGICTYSQKIHCTNLVRGLIQHGPQDIRIFVYDNKPEPSVLEFFDDELKNDSRISVSLDASNPGYIRPNNYMARACRSQYHIVSNDDVLVGHDWFGPLRAALEADPMLAVVGPEPKFGFLDRQFDGQSYKNAGRLDYIEGWWMMFPREVIDRHGLFDEDHLRIATCEDSDCCLRLQEAGWKIQVIPDLPIIHLEHQTKNESKNYSWGFENKAWCKERWHYYLEHGRFENR